MRAGSKARELILLHGGGGFTPKNISGLALWMQADDLAGDDGDAIASWVSKEGNNYSFAQADADKKPLLKKAANGINGRNVVRFDGTNDLLVLGSAPLTGETGTVIAVYRLTSTLGNYQHILSSCDEASVNFTMRFMAAYDGAGKPIAISKNGGGIDEVKGSTTISAEAVYCAVYQSNGIAYTARVNKTAQTFTIVAGGNNGAWFGDIANRDNTTIGSLKRTTEAAFLKGDLAELIVYNSALSSAQITNVERYLEDRYGNFF